MQQLERGDRAGRRVDHERLGAICERGLHRALDLAVGLDEVAHQTAQPEAIARRGVALEQVARARGDVLAALQHLAQRHEPRALALDLLARGAQRVVGRALRRHGGVVALERAAHRVHHAIALREQVAQTLLEVVLLAIGARRLALPELEHLVGVAQPRLELRAPIFDRGEPILRARDRGEHGDERGIGGLALALERLEPLARLAHLRLGPAQRLGARRHGPLDRGELLLDLARRRGRAPRAARGAPRARRRASRRAPRATRARAARTRSGPRTP